jgi:hypothetical protein
MKYLAALWCSFMTIFSSSISAGLGCVVERTKFEFEFGLEQIPIAEPGRLGLNLAEDGGLAILKCHFSKIRDGILDLGRACLESRWAVSKVKHAL